MLERRRNCQHVALLTSCLTGSAWAQPAESNSASDSASASAPVGEVSTEPNPARGHFDNGVRLYQDGNYPAALVEFEAAYRLQPGASSLQNIALCQKALFRYAAAAATLAKLLERYAGTLTEGERRDIEAALRELRALTRRVIFRVSPAEARLEVNGASQDAEARQRGIELNVGEHLIAASAPGYTSQQRSIQVASGESAAIVQIALEPLAGFVTVITETPGAAIAIDGRALAYQRWSGPLEPGEHWLQIYKTGHETVERVFELELGERKLIRESAGGELEESAVAPARNSARGWYGLGAFNWLLVPDAPDGVRVDESFDSQAISWGGRAGYRLFRPLGVELLIEGGITRVDDACIEDPEKWPELNARRCDQNDDSPGLSYAIDAFRLGGNVRLFSSGERSRFTSSLGFGGVTHRFELREPEGQLDDAQALNAFVLVEIGVQFNIQHVLLQADFVTYVESRGSLGHGERDLFNEGGLKSLGLGLKAGWGEWKRADAQRGSGL